MTRSARRSPLLPTRTEVGARTAVDHAHDGAGEPLRDERDRRCVSMTSPTEFCRWWITDEQTGLRYLSAFKLCRAHAERAFPGAKPDFASLEIRDVLDPRASDSESPDGD